MPSGVVSTIPVLKPGPDAVTNTHSDSPALSRHRELAEREQPRRGARAAQGNTDITGKVWWDITLVYP